MMSNEQREKILNAERRQYRAACKVRCLEANLTRITPQEFDQLMTQLEAAKAEAQAQAQQNAQNAASQVEQMNQANAEAEAAGNEPPYSQEQIQNMQNSHQ